MIVEGDVGFANGQKRRLGHEIPATPHRDLEMTASMMRALAATPHHELEMTPHPHVAASTMQAKVQNFVGQQHALAQQACGVTHATSISIWKAQHKR